MATELVTFKMDKKFLKEVDETVKKAGYGNRTEFIRQSLRENVDKVKLKEAMIRLGRFKGISKKKTTDAEYERIREQAMINLAKKRGWDLD